MDESLDWTLIRDRVRRRDDHTCQRCGFSANKETEHHLEVHHITPRAEGGTNALDNLTTICEVCHDEIHADAKPGEVAKYTGNAFQAWLEEYDGAEKEPWDSEYICTECGHRWVGKPYAERSSRPQCVNSDCNATSRGVCIEIGEVYFPITTLKSIQKNDEPLNYTGIEVKQPIEEFTPVSLFEHYSEFSKRFLPYIVYSRRDIEVEIEQ